MGNKSSVVPIIDNDNTSCICEQCNQNAENIRESEEKFKNKCRSIMNNFSQINEDIEIIYKILNDHRKIIDANKSFYKSKKEIKMLC
jgi:predicted transcriptional regulator